MNICVITSSFPLNDADPMGGFAYEFCLELAKTNNVTIITQKRSGDYQINKKLNLIAFEWAGKDAALAELNFYKINHLFYAVSLFMNGERALRNYVKKNKVDHCFALWALPSGVGAYYLRLMYRIPYDIWCLGSDIWDFKDNFFSKFVLRKILRRAKNVYADGFNFAKDIEVLCQRPSKFLATSQNLPKGWCHGDNQKDAKKTFLFIGRYHYNKGPDILLEAISLLTKAIIDKSSFIFYGEGVLKDQMLESVVKLKLDNVVINDLIGKNEIFEAFSKAHFIIIPSRFDSIPVILSDALQCNTPMIGAMTGDLGDVIRNYNLGYTFEKENVSELSQMIEKAFYDNKESYLVDIIKAQPVFSVEGAVKEFVKNINI